MLKFFLIDLSEELEVIKYLLANNSETLQTFHFITTEFITSNEVQDIRNLDFLYLNPIMKLTELKISKLLNMKGMLDHASEINFKLPLVKYLDLCFQIYYYNDFHHLVILHWEENLIKWITQIFPNLEDLKLKIIPNELDPVRPPQLKQQDISTLLFRLPKLAKMSLDVKYDGLFRDRSVNLVSTEAEQWIFQNYAKSFAIPINRFGCKSYYLYR